MNVRLAGRIFSRFNFKLLCNDVECEEKTIARVEIANELIEASLYTLNTHLKQGATTLQVIYHGSARLMKKITAEKIPLSNHIHFKASE